MSVLLRSQLSLIEPDPDGPPPLSPAVVVSTVNAGWLTSPALEAFVAVVLVDPVWDSGQ